MTNFWFKAKFFELNDMPPCKNNSLTSCFIVLANVRLYIDSFMLFLSKSLLLSRGHILTPKEIKAPKMVPEMLAKPPVITAWISETVSSLMYGRIRRGESV